MALLLAIALMIGLALIVNSVIKSSMTQSNAVARERFVQILEESRQYGDDLKAEIKNARKSARRSPLQALFSQMMNSLAGNIRTRQLLSEGEGPDLLSYIDRQLEVAGLRDRLDAYQAIAFTLIFWACGVAVPTLLYLAGGFPVFLFIAVVGLFLAYPYLKVRSMQKSRRTEIEAEVPFFIQELSMALSTGSTSIDDAILRVAKNGASSPRRSILAEEFRRALNDYRMGGVPQSDALRAIGDRTEVLSVQTLVETIITGLETGNDSLPDTLDSYAQQARDQWRESIRTYIAKKEPLITLSLVLTMFGGFVLYGAPLVIQVLQTMGGMP